MIGDQRRGPARGVLSNTLIVMLLALVGSWVVLAMLWLKKGVSTIEPGLHASVDRAVSGYGANLDSHSQFTPLGVSRPGEYDRPWVTRETVRPRSVESDASLISADGLGRGAEFESDRPREQLATLEEDVRHGRDALRELRETVRSLRARLRHEFPDSPVNLAAFDDFTDPSGNFTRSGLQCAAIELCSNLDMEIVDSELRAVVPHYARYRQASQQVGWSLDEAGRQLQLEDLTADEARAVRDSVTAAQQAIDTLERRLRMDLAPVLGTTRAEELVSTMHSKFVQFRAEVRRMQGIDDDGG